MKKTLIFTLLYLLFNSSFAQTVNTSLEEVRDKSELLIGFNRRSDKGTWWTDNTFIDRVADMNPDVMRYPAGTQANYWDWSTGKFLNGTDKSWNNKEILHIPEFINALPERTKVIYVINLARPTPATGVSVNATEEILKNTETLNAKIQDMLHAIAEFEVQGKLPFAIELGNEFFFGNEESGIFNIVEENDGWHSGWDSINNQSFVSSDKKNATTLNAKFYLDQCKVVVSRISYIYPNLKFALVTTKMGNGDSTRDFWNNTIFGELEKNPVYTDLQNSIYAITQHHYLSTNYGDQTVIFDNATAEIAIAEGVQYPIGRQQDYDMVPDDYKIWYTEYGASKDNAVETWATGLRYGALVLSWLNRGDKVEQLDYHYVSKNDVIKTGSPMKLAPIGIVAKLLAVASVNMDEMQEIIFSNNPISVNGIKSLYGYKFKNEDKEALFIINISDSDFSQIITSDILTYEGRYKRTQYNSDMPYVNGVYEGHNIAKNTSTVNTTSFSASKFSVTVIEKGKKIVSLANIPINQFAIYPNPAGNYLNISTLLALNEVIIWNIKGEKAIAIKNPKRPIDIKNLVAGLYFVEMLSEDQSLIRKLVISK